MYVQLASQGRVELLPISLTCYWETAIIRRPPIPTITLSITQNVDCCLLCHVVKIHRSTFFPLVAKKACILTVDNVSCRNFWQDTVLTNQTLALWSWQVKDQRGVIRNILSRIHIESSTNRSNNNIPTWFFPVAFSLLFVDGQFWEAFTIDASEP